MKVARSKGKYYPRHALANRSFSILFSFVLFFFTLSHLSHFLPPSFYSYFLAREKGANRKEREEIKDKMMAEGSLSFHEISAVRDGVLSFGKECLTAFCPHFLPFSFILSFLFRFLSLRAHGRKTRKEKKNEKE